MKYYLELTKPRIVKLVVITGLIGYALGYPFESTFSIIHLIIFVLGLSLVSAGSLGLNSAQEWKYDALMPRTQMRPLPQKKISVQSAFVFSIVLVALGILFLYIINPLSAWLGLLTVLLYNVLYTMLLKRTSPFAAVPGAIPGAMPVVLGYSAVNSQIFSPDCVYVFLLMFLWQMPHFWSLAIRYVDDYKSGGYPVLPVEFGKNRTLFHMSLYILPYIALAVLSPWFIETSYFYFILVLPFAFISTFEFYKFVKSEAQRNWVRFFIWINLSMLAFLIAPVLDRWYFYVAKGLLRQ